MKRQSQYIGSCRLKTMLKFITKNKINKDSLFIFFFLSSKCVKIARLAIQQNPINQSYQIIKKKEKKITLFLIALVLIK